MSYAAHILRGAKGPGELPALPKELFRDGAEALSGALAAASNTIHVNHMLDNLGNHLCDNEGNYFTLQ